MQGEPEQYFVESVRQCRAGTGFRFAIGDARRNDPASSGTHARVVEVKPALENMTET